MKNPVLAIACFALMFVGCGDEEVSFDDFIQGVWVNTHVNDQPVLTDEAFVCDYRADMTQLYAIGITLDQDNKSWIENTAYSYVLDGKTITVEGPDVFNNYFYMEFTILSMDKDTMRYAVEAFRINGEDFPDPNTYTLAKVKTRFEDAFIGTWYGRSTTPGGPETYHYWDFFTDGSFDYYYEDDDGNWINKPDNEGKYFLYGRFLASNYSNDLLSGETGQAFECWNITINDDNMFWEGLRENNHLATFEMVRVDNPFKHGLSPWLSIKP